MTDRTQFQPRTIAIIGGTGAQGGGLALRWARAGHRIIVASRDPAKAERAVAGMAALVPEGSLSHAGYVDAASRGEIVVLTVPYAAQRASVEEIGEAVAGKILVDATVPLKPPKVARVQLPPGGSAVLALQDVAPASTRIVSAFQNVSASHLQDVEHGLDCDVLVAGDDPEARQVVIGLSRDIGLRAWHAGPLCNSAAAEALTSVLIAINSRYKVPGAGIRITGIPDA
ncbi:MAG TPA: NADPH-dependent F420 reductase [Ramlibacter sp.]|nr:NADPH-dependent F420 reductase [Ramlibacter sp.]